MITMPVVRSPASRDFVRFYSIDCFLAHRTQLWQFLKCQLVFCLNLPEPLSNIFTCYARSVVTPEFTLETQSELQRVGQHEYLDFP